jgi:hypothetical protein
MDKDLKALDKLSMEMFLALKQLEKHWISNIRNWALIYNQFQIL